MIEKITIIGMGLIGSSIARAIQKNNLAKTLVAADINTDICHKVVDLGLADIVTDELALAVEDADLVVICVPVGAMERVGKSIAGALKQGAIITDTGSSKMSVIDALKPFCRSGIELVPAHPVFLNNKEAVLEVLGRFTEDLTAMQRAIRKGDGDYLYQKLSDTREIRQAIVEQGQARYISPKGGDSSD